MILYNFDLLFQSTLVKSFITCITHITSIQSTLQTCKHLRSACVKCYHNISPKLPIAWKIPLSESSLNCQLIVFRHTSVFEISRLGFSFTFCFLLLMWPGAEIYLFSMNFSFWILNLGIMVEPVWRLSKTSARRHDAMELTKKEFQEQAVNSEKPSKSLNNALRVVTKLFTICL